MAFLFWPDSSEAQAQANLRNLLFALRHALPSFERYVCYDKRTVQWRGDGCVSSDVDDFHSALAAAGRATDRAHALRTVVDLYTGDLLPSCYDEWILLPRERLRQHFLGALQSLIDVLQHNGDPGAAILYAQLLLRHDALQEQNYRQVMSLHLAAGDGAAVLNVYRQCERVLQHDLLVQPSLATRDLARRAKELSAGSHPGRESSRREEDLRADPASHAVVRVPEPGNLPAQTTTFVGREREVVAISAQLQKAECRLVTLTGTAGTGKTRLALQIAERLHGFADGVFFVPLAALTKPSMVPDAVAAALGVAESTGHTLRDALLSHLCNKHLLLVLDNFEHLLVPRPEPRSAAGWVADLLARCPYVKVLATSRSPLNLRGEHEHVVPPLSVPGRDMPARPDELAQYEAVALFVERATEVSPHFALTRESAHAVAEVCRSLEGLPLALELAAARVKVLSPEAILSRLDRRLKLLVGGKSDLPDRQRTLEAAIDWSYNLLDMSEQALFRVLGVFSGGCTLEAAEATAAGAGASEQFLDCMSSLVNKSLLSRVDAGTPGSPPRFVMLETLRDYALEKARKQSEDRALRRRHALYFMGLAEEAEPHLAGPKQIEWLNRLEADNDNFRAALQWAQEVSAGKGEASLEASEIALRLAGALWRFWLFRGHVAKGREHVARVVDGHIHESEQTNEDSERSLQASLAKALFGAGGLAFQQDDYPAARSYNEQCLLIRRKLGDREGIIQSLQTLGYSAQMECNYELARSLYAQTLSMAQELDSNAEAIAYSLLHLGEIAQIGADYALARSLFEQSRAVAQGAGDTWAQAHALSKLGSVVQSERDYASARPLYERALLLAREVGHRGGIAETLGYMGSLAVAENDFARARSLYRESLAIRRDIGDRTGLAACLTGYGALATAEALAMPPVRQEQQARIAAQLLGAEQMLIEIIGTPCLCLEYLVYEQGAEIARRLLGETVFAKAHAEGRAMSLEDALALAESLG
jgi:predicted ATPase/DNA-binding SARP family transcriptional activator